ncbi:MAG: gamma carbonic anhydrase family protein [Acidobacteria bacterium]|nr:gamma carbonic anhydrase family protein [Acidobacteriota bacterium]
MIRPFRGQHPHIHPTAFVEESAQIVGDVIIGAESSVWFNAVVRGDVFHIRIGERTNIQDGTVVHVSNGTHATILEDEVTVGHNVTLHGCHVGRGCLVGMGSIVGVPARVKRPLTDEEVAGLDSFWQNYVEYTRAYRAEYGIDGGA